MAEEYSPALEKLLNGQQKEGYKVLIIEGNFSGEFTPSKISLPKCRSIPGGLEREVISLKDGYMLFRGGEPRATYEVKEGKKSGDKKLLIYCIINDPKFCN